MNEQQDPNQKISKPLKPLYNLGKRLEGFNAKDFGKQQQCPNCEQYKAFRPFYAYGFGGLFAAFLGLPWVLIFIGIPVVIGGLLVSIAGFVTPKNEWHCKNCKYKWSV